MISREGDGRGWNPAPTMEDIVNCRGDYQLPEWLLPRELQRVWETEEKSKALRIFAGAFVSGSFEFVTARG